MSCDNDLNKAGGKNPYNLIPTVIIKLYNIWDLPKSNLWLGGVNVGIADARLAMVVKR